MSAWRLSMSSTRKTHFAPAYSWLPEAVDAGVDVAVEAGAVQCIEAAAAVAAQCAEAAEAAEAAVVAAEAAAHGLDLSGSARTVGIMTASPLAENGSLLIALKHRMRKSSSASITNRRRRQIGRGRR
jgi:hypothetical protein